MRFTVTGPILTVTLKDPYAENVPPKTIPKDSKAESDDSTTPSTSNIFTRLLSKQNPSSYSPANILGLSSLAPTLIWAARSTSPPLPNYLPQLRSTSLTAGYRYDDMKNAPSFFEGSLNLSLGKGIEMDVTPSYGVRKEVLGMVVRVGGNGDG